MEIYFWPWAAHEGPIRSRSKGRHVPFEVKPAFQLSGQRNHRRDPALHTQTGVRDLFSSLTIRLPSLSEILSEERSWAVIGHQQTVSEWSFITRSLPPVVCDDRVQSFALDTVWQGRSANGPSPPRLSADCRHQESQSLWLTRRGFINGSLQGVAGSIFYTVLYLTFKAAQCSIYSLHTISFQSQGCSRDLTSCYRTSWNCTVCKAPSGYTYPLFNRTVENRCVSADLHCGSYSSVNRGLHTLVKKKEEER